MIGIMSLGLVDGAMLSAAPTFELGRGAIAGAFIVAAAFLAGCVAIRRSGLALCALIMVLAAGALEFSWLGLFSALPAKASVFVLGLFIAAVIVFLSASISGSRRSAVLSGVMFAAALAIAGLGLINFVDRINVTPLMRWAAMGVGGLGGAVVLVRALSGDYTARLIMPGLVLAAIAPAVGPLGFVGGESFALLPHALFSLGILGASFVALADGAASGPIRHVSPELDVVQSFDASDEADVAFAKASEKRRRERAEIVLDSQLARVLDYSGVAVWDWSPTLVDQTETLAELLGADSNAPFTPEALRNFIHKEDIARFESEVVAPIDGPFDVALKLYDGRKVRMRGARAADEERGALERLVAFIETASPIFRPSAKGVDGAAVQKATAAAIVPPAASRVVRNMAEALDNGDIVAAFQPIVALKDEKIVGYEALARWPNQGASAGESPETFAKAADIAGKGGALAKTMLDQAAAFLAEKQKSDKRKHLFVAMNATWTQMRDAGFVDLVRKAIATYGLPKNALVLELTEGDAVTDDDEAGRVFTALKAAGAALAFDDFGAGFSCLANLRKYDFDYLKIDKSFADDLDSKGDGAKIVGSLASLGKDLGLKVIVEGVETRSAAKMASSLGCAYGQGFALGAPEETPRENVKTGQEPASAGLAAASSQADEEPSEAELGAEARLVDAAVAKDDDARAEAEHQCATRWMSRRRTFR